MSDVQSNDNVMPPTADAMLDSLLGQPSTTNAVLSSNNNVPLKAEDMLDQMLKQPTDGNASNQVNSVLLNPSQTVKPSGNANNQNNSPIGEQVARQLGLTGRYLINGAMALPNTVGDLANTGINDATGEINKLTGASIPALGMPSQTTDALLTEAGYPSPQTPTEQKVGDVSRLLAGITSGGEGFFNDIKTAGTNLVDAMGSNNITPKAIKNVANVLYKRADDLGGAYGPNFIGKVFDDMTGPAPKTPTEIASAQNDPVRNIISKYEAARGQPFTLSDGQILDEKIGDEIEKNTDPISGPNSDAVALKQAQSKLRDALVNPDTKDITGTAEGAQALASARQAWSQAMKANDIQRIMTRAKYSQNPATVLQTGARNLLVSGGEDNPRGWNDDETSALRDMANTGAGTNVLRMLGSRLVPYMGTAIGESVGGLPGAAIGTAVGHTGAAIARKGASAIQTGKAQNVVNILGKNYPKLSDLPSNRPPMPSAVGSLIDILSGDR